MPNFLVLNQQQRDILLDQLEAKIFCFRQARRALTKLRSTVDLRPEELDELETQIEDLDDKVRRVDRRIDAFILNAASLPLPSKNALQSMKKAVEKLEKINRKDRLTRAIIKTVTKIVDDVRNLS